MPRKPLGRSQLVKHHPLTFSPFSRSIAQIGSISMVNRQKNGSLIHKSNVPSSSVGKESVDNNVESESDDIETSDDEEFDGVIQADFEFFDPKPDDFHGVKTLLQTYLDIKEWDLSGFADLILGQPTVGTVVKIADDEDNGIFSVVSALNLYRYKDNKCIVEIKEFLHRVCQEKNIRDDLKSLLGEEARNVGLLVSQRVSNLPPQLLPPLYDALFDEVSWATEDEPTEELRKSFCFKFYLVITKFYELKSTSQKRRQNSKTSGDEGTIYVKPEDEIFHKLSLWSVSFPLQTQPVPPHELRNYRLMGLVMVVEAEKIPTFRQELKSLISES